MKRASSAVEFLDMDLSFLNRDKYAAALSMHVSDAKEISLTVLEKFAGSPQAFRLRYRNGPLYDSYVRFFDLDPAPSRPASFRGVLILAWRSHRVYLSADWPPGLE